MRQELLTQAILFFAFSTVIFVIGAAYYSKFIKKHDNEDTESSSTFRAVVVGILMGAIVGVSNYVYNSAEDTILKNAELEKLQIKATELNSQLADIKIEQEERTTISNDHKSVYDKYTPSDLRNAEQRINSDISATKLKIDDINKGKYKIHNGVLFIPSKVLG